jgi:hypothetical protein
LTTGEDEHHLLLLPDFDKLHKADALLGAEALQKVVNVIADACDFIVRIVRLWKTN